MCVYSRLLPQDSAPLCSVLQTDLHDQRFQKAYIATLPRKDWNKRWRRWLRCTALVYVTGLRGHERLHERLHERPDTELELRFRGFYERQQALPVRRLHERFENNALEIKRGGV